MPSCSIGFCVARTNSGRSRAKPRAVDRDLVLLHRFEQGRLGLRRRAVDFVGEQDVGEDRAADEADHAAARGPVLFDHLGAEDVGGHQVGRELDAVELEVDCLRQLLDQQRLGEAGHAAQQAVAAGEEGDQDLADDALLADDRLGELAARAAPRRRPRDRDRARRRFACASCPTSMRCECTAGSRGVSRPVQQCRRSRFDTFEGGEVP